MTDGYEALDMKCQMIIDDFDEKLPLFQEIKDAAISKISEVLKANDMEVTAVEARVKRHIRIQGVRPINKRSI